MGATHSCVGLGELVMGHKGKKIGTWCFCAVYQGRPVTEPTNERWLEEGLWAPKAFISNGDHLTIRKLIAFFQRRGRCSSGHLIFKVQGHVTELFLDVTDNFTLRCKEDLIFKMAFRKDPNMLTDCSLSPSNTLPVF